MIWFRTRYLLHKYFMKWTNRVFGRVLPSVARQHSTERCKRKVLMAWQEEWWVERKEWKLGIRAECHNRYTRPPDLPFFFSRATI